MSDQEYKSLKFNNVVTVAIAIISCSTAVLGFTIRSQMQNIALKQDNAILQVKSDVSDRYITKEYFISQQYITTATEAKLADALKTLADLESADHVAIEVFQSQLKQQKQYN